MSNPQDFSSPPRRRIILVPNPSDFDYSVEDRQITPTVPNMESNTTDDVLLQHNTTQPSVSVIASSQSEPTVCVPEAPTSGFGEPVAHCSKNPPPPSPSIPTTTSNIGSNPVNIDTEAETMGQDNNPLQPNAAQEETHTLTTDRLNCLLFKEIMENLLTVTPTYNSWQQSLERSNAVVQQMSSKIASLETSTETAQNCRERMEADMKRIQENITNLQTILMKLKDETGSLNSAAQRIKRQLQEALDDSVELKDAVRVYLTRSMDQVKDDLSQVSNHMNQLRDGWNKNVQDIQRLVQDMESLKDGTEQREQDADKLRESLEELKKEMVQLKKCRLELQFQVNHIKKCMGSQEPKLKSLQKKMDDLMGNMTKKSDELKRGGDELKQSVNQLRIDVDKGFNEQQQRSATRQKFDLALALGLNEVLDEKDERDDRLETEIGELRQNVTVAKNSFANLKVRMNTFVEKLDEVAAVRNQIPLPGENQDVRVPPQHVSDNEQDDSSDESDSEVPVNNTTVKKNESQLQLSNNNLTSNAPSSHSVSGAVVVEHNLSTLPQTRSLTKLVRNVAAAAATASQTKDGSSIQKKYELKRVQPSQTHATKTRGEPVQKKGKVIKKAAVSSTAVIGASKKKLDDSNSIDDNAPVASRPKRKLDQQERKKVASDNPQTESKHEQRTIKSRARKGEIEKVGRAQKKAEAPPTMHIQTRSSVQAKRPVNKVPQEKKHRSQFQMLKATFASIDNPKIVSGRQTRNSMKAAADAADGNANSEAKRDSKRKSK